MEDDNPDYRVIYATDIPKLQDGVAHMIRKGWRPIGGVAVLPIDGEDARWAQAIVPTAV